MWRYNRIIVNLPRIEMVVEMNQLTIRGIPPKVERVIKEEAKRKGQSLNKIIISLLEKATGIKKEERKKQKLYHDLDHLSGIWTREEEIAFRTELKAQRKVDEGLWK
jgi:hypothetical protein